jgi:hypothetical protein
MRKTLIFAAIVEIGTGLGLVLVPALVAALLLGADLDAVAIVIARCFGAALMALGLACWSDRWVGPTRRWPLRGMFTYNFLLASYLGYLGGVGRFSGPLLWPAAALHGVVAVALARGLLRSSGGGRS